MLDAIIRYIYLKNKNRDILEYITKPIYKHNFT